MRAYLRDIIDHVIKDSIVIGCAFSQSGKVTICALDSILRPEYSHLSWYNYLGTKSCTAHSNQNYNRYNSIYMHIQDTLNII